MNPHLRHDVSLLFTTRILRLFAYGFISVVLVLHLAAIGIEETRIGLLLTLALAGDVVISLILTTRADRIGRRRTLAAGAVLMAAAGAVFAATGNFTALVLAATLGVISPSGNEVGPFLPIEQVALTHAAPQRDRTSLFAWYNLSGSFATAVGSLAAGAYSQLLHERGWTEVATYRSMIVLYAATGVVLLFCFLRLSPRIEVEPVIGRAPLFHVDASRRAVTRLSALFALDSFGGGLVVQSAVAYWFHQRFGMSPAHIGAIFFGANLLAGISALGAARLAQRFGLVNVMVFTHLPSNVLLILVPFMPTAPLAIAVLLVRFSISQMDVPTRQAYVMAIVDPRERTAAAGITGVARTTGAALAPVLAVPLLSSIGYHWVPFVAAGALKIVYDLLLLASARRT